MNEEDLDLLASAYADGEATSEEVAMVERDPALAARVEARVAEFRAIDEQIASVPLPPVQLRSDLKEQHLAAALAEFDTVPRTIGSAPATVNVAGGTAPAAVTESDGGEVIDLAGRSAKRESRRRRWFGDPGAVPSFVTAAAAVVLIGGGVVFAAGQLGSGDDSTDTAAADFDEEATEDAAEAADEAGEESAEALNQSRAADDEAMELAEEAMADEEEAMEEEPAEEDQGETADSAPATTTTGGVDAESDDGGGDAETTEGGLFPNEPVMRFDQVPDADQAMSEMPERRTDLFRSLCADFLTLPDGSEVVAFAPIEVGGEPAELFVIVGEDGNESGLIVDGACGAMDG